jgi:flagellar hook-basal body complex protein FliE
LPSEFAGNPPASHVDFDEKLAGRNRAGGKQVGKDAKVMLPVTVVPVSLFGAPQSVPVSVSLSSIQPAAGVASADGAVRTTSVEESVVRGAAAGSSPLESSPGTASPAASPAPFADLLTEALGQADLLERQARESVEGLMQGTGVDVHQAMIATEKAEMAFDLVLAVRNKALAAYQQVVAMQF